jgi:hypothetical protein
VKTFLLVACALVVAARADDWQATLSPPSPGPFPAPRSLQAHYRFGWMNVTAGEGDFDFRKRTSGEVQLEVRAKTVGLARSLWRLDALHSAVARAATLRPLTMRQTEIYKDETLITDLWFDAKGVTRLRQTKPPETEPAKEKRFKFAHTFDLHTALLWIRSQRLLRGDVYRLVVYPATAPYLAQVTVAGRDEIKALNRTYRAIRLDLKLRRIASKTFELAPHAKFKRATAWLSDDNDRLFLQTNAEIFVGSVWMKLEQVRQSTAAATINPQ